MFWKCFCIKTTTHAYLNQPHVSAAGLPYAQPGNGTRNNLLFNSTPHVRIRTVNIVCGRLESAENVTAANYERQEKKKGHTEGGAESMNGSCFNGRLSEGTRDDIVSLLKVSG